MIKVFVPRDAAALSMGADAVAKAIAARSQEAQLPRSRSSATARAACCGSSRWSRSRRADGRVAYGPVKPADVPGLVQGQVPQRRQAQALARPHRRDPLLQKPGAPDLRPLRRHRSAVDRGLPRSRRLRRAHQRARPWRRCDIVTEVTTSGLRGRGGAGFPTGIKWKTVHDAKADQKYICCNADEGDSGTFADRMLMEGDPYCLIEGMTIAGIAVGATKGYIYVRSEYPHAVNTLREAIRIATDRQLARAHHPRHTARLRIVRAHGRRRLHLRRGNLDAGKPRGHAAVWCATSRRCRRSRACSASRPSSTTC